VVNPFIPVYAVQINASPKEMGWVRAISIVSGNIGQIPWGLAADKLKKRVLFIFTGGVLNALLMLLLIYVDSISEFMLTIALIATSTAMIAPALTSLVGDLAGESKRGRVLANLNAAASLGSMPATLISGYILYKVGGNLQEMYRIPVIIAFVFNLSAAFSSLRIRERFSKGESFAFRGWTKALKANTYLRRLCVISSFQGFFMATAWPIFTLTVVKVIKADMFQIALLTVITSLTAFFVRRFTGSLADRAGRKPLLMIGRGGLFLVPLVYAFATSIYELLIVDFIVGFVMASSDIAISAYLLDISPRTIRGSYTALYNTVTGISTFMGSIAGGYFMEIFTGLGFGFEESLRLVYAISVIGRLAGGTLFITLKEPYRYPAQFREELLKILREDAEKLKEDLRMLEERAEEYMELMEKEDAEWFEKMSSRPSH